MALKQQAIEYIMNLEKDFSVSDIIEKGFSKSMAHSVKTQLLEARSIFCVGLRYINSGECKLYNTTYRPFSSIPTGIPMTETQQIMEYMLWLEKDFTIMQIRQDLNTSRTIVYNAKKKLIVEGLLFHVGNITHKSPIKGLVYIKVFSKEDKEFKVKHKEKVRKYKKIETRQKEPKRKLFNPADPLAGFAVPR